MTFLALMALSASFTLSTMTNRWSSGLENKLTIEIPAQKPDGTIIGTADQEGLVARVTKSLAQDSRIIEFEVLEQDDIAELVSPWLGNNIMLTDIPLPVLISVETSALNEEQHEDLEIEIRSIFSAIKLDRHESWLADLLRFTGAMQIASFLISLIICITTITAIAGAIRSRMAVHKAEVELLHLMGASDNYITRQFQRYARSLCFSGGILGTLIGAASLLAIHIFTNGVTDSLLPELKLDALHIATITGIPFLAAAIGTITARMTVLRTLAQML